MQKLKLDIEELVVESCEMTETEESRGTVHGQAIVTFGCGFFSTLWMYYNIP